MTQSDTPAKPASRTPPEIWAAARDDYLAGDSAPVVAERHGLSLRSFQRRAGIEGWRRADISVPSPRDAPIWGRGLTKAQLIELHPELADIEEVRADEVFQLLFEPTAVELRRFAFRRAAELAATDSPRQALLWMRLVQMLDRPGDRIDEEAAAFTPVDHLRAAFLRRIGEDFDPPEPASAPPPIE
ncbi:MAG: hypothetical protein EBR82_14775 [Caulobacteraceae bacterium]|nr:hypothetical protein [Caulobacteraceae bacterium]